MTVTIPNCFTLALPRKPGGPGRVRIDKESSRRLVRRDRDDLPDGQVPTARILRLESSKPKFQSNRKGWRRFYRWQDWFNRRLELKDQLSYWPSQRAHRAARERAGASSQDSADKQAGAA